MSFKKFMRNRIKGYAYFGARTILNLCIQTVFKKFMENTYDKKITHEFQYFLASKQI